MKVVVVVVVETFGQGMNAWASLIPVLINTSLSSIYASDVELFCWPW